MWVIKSGKANSMMIDQSQMSRTAMSACAILLTAVLAGTPSAHAATANIYASATIVPPVGVAERSDMRVSGFVAGATPGTITLSVPPALSEPALSEPALSEPALSEVAPTQTTPVDSGKRKGSGGVRLLGQANCLAMNDCSVGAVQIGGPSSASFSGVSTQSTTTLTSGDNIMTLGGVKLRYGADGTAGTISGPGLLNASGTGTIMIGGVLNVAAGQATGNYRGSLIVSVDY
jgi:hypothetical protein